MINFIALLVVGVIAGQAHADAPEAIIGGHSAGFGQFPYQASLQFFGEHNCGGSIISDRHILTAAHCVEELDYHKYMDVITGALWSTRKDGVVHKIKCINLHEEYDGRRESGWKNDIALITLEKPIEFNKTQKAIPLATEDYATGEHRGIISGWGKTDVKSEAAPYLQWVKVNVLSQEACLAAHPEKRLGRAFTTPKQICTLERRGQGACQGDSGGPLVVNGKVAGIVSWVIPCARGISDVFTKVSEYVDWIKEAQTKC